MSPVGRVEVLAKVDGEGGLQPNLAAVLRSHPCRWSPPTIGAASAVKRDLADQEWFDVLEQLEAAFGTVMPEEMTADRAPSGILSTRSLPSAPKATG
jgi:hypothetical protein